MSEAAQTTPSLEWAPRNGRITIRGGRLVAIDRLWFPRRASLALVWMDRRMRRRVSADHCVLYYSGTRSQPGFTTLDYVISGPGTSFATFRRALVVLDQVARCRHSVAIFAHVGNDRISDRLMRRWGWQPHAARLGKGHWIKRFYGS